MSSDLAVNSPGLDLKKRPCLTRRGKLNDGKFHRRPPTRGHRRANLTEVTPIGGKINTADLAARVERLELEARENEARVRIIRSRAELEKVRAEHPAMGGKSRS